MRSVAINFQKSNEFVIHQCQPCHYKYKVDNGCNAAAALMITVVINIPDLTAKGLTHEYLKKWDTIFVKYIKKSNFTSIYIKLLQLAILLTEDPK